MKTLRACDLFCGAGGSSTGLASVCEEIGRRLDLTAVNHWPIAVETHSANHPGARHLCETLDGVDPRQLYEPGKLDLLLASPECTNHSRAKGGMPVNDQSRSTAWHVIRWADALRPRAILVENVQEFLRWGPIGSSGRPLKSREGQTFYAWAGALGSLGYTVRWRVLNSADYGAATSRERLFVQAVRGRQAIRWPEPTHAKATTKDLFGELPRWRGAKEVIDWGVKGKSIFTRKKPLKENTVRRIRAGLEKFGGEAARPFLALLDGVPAVVPRDHMALVEPMVLGQHGGAVARTISEPLPTVATVGAISFIVPTNYGERPGQSPRCHAADAPLPTVVAGGVTHGLVQPYLVPYYGTGEVDSVEDPARTVTTRDRLGLVQPVAGVTHDILFRMLLPHELSAAMGFPRDYVFRGNRGEQVKQIGNAVEVNIARALCRAVLAEKAGAK